MLIISLLERKGSQAVRRRDGTDGSPQRFAQKNIIKSVQICAICELIIKKQVQILDFHFKKTVCPKGMTVFLWSNKPLDNQPLASF